MTDYTNANIPKDAKKKIKVYCAKNGLKMGEWVAKTCLEKIQNRNSGWLHVESGTHCEVIQPKKKD